MELNYSQSTLSPRKRDIGVGAFSPNSFVLLWLMPGICRVNHKSLKITECWNKWTLFKISVLDADSLKLYDSGFPRCAVFTGVKKDFRDQVSRTIQGFPWVWSGSFLMTCQEPLVKCIIEVVKRLVSSLFFSHSQMF